MQIEILQLYRGIEWSLRAFASMRAERLFLRARAVINFLMRAVSTLDITKGEQRAFCKFSASWILSLLRRCFAPSNVADTFKTELRPASFKRQQNEEAYVQSRNFNENPNMRALAKILRARASEHSSNFC